MPLSNTDIVNSPIWTGNMDSAQIRTWTSLRCSKCDVWDRSRVSLFMFAIITQQFGYGTTIHQLKNNSKKMPWLQNEHQSASTQTHLARVNSLLEGSLCSTKENSNWSLTRQEILPIIAERKHIINDTEIQATHTVTYWVRGQPTPQAPADGGGREARDVYESPGWYRSSRWTQGLADAKDGRTTEKIPLPSNTPLIFILSNDVSSQLPGLRLWNNTCKINLKNK